MNTLKYDFFYNSQLPSDLSDWLSLLKPAISEACDPSRHGDLPRWLSALNDLPAITTDETCLDREQVTSQSAGLTPALQQQIESALRRLHPWRKGPFNLHGIEIDSEWRCDQKWARLSPHVDLTDKTVLDVGCGNGYYCLRMLGHGARVAVGIDPNLLFCTQFLAANHFIKQHRACVFPLGVEALESHSYLFDTVFSMGILYHRREPLEHLKTLASLLRPGGELVLETLIIEGRESVELIPEHRYANMRNVWSLPTISFLEQQLSRTGFKHIECVDITQTSTHEQRSTAWMNFHSLEQALDSTDKNKTVEGLPAPLRAIVTARRGPL